MNDRVTANNEDKNEDKKPDCTGQDRRQRFECYVKDCRKCAEVVCTKFWFRRPWRQSPEDCVQETLLRAWERFDSFRGTTHAEFCEWLKSIARTRSSDDLRNPQRHFEAQADSSFDAKNTADGLPSQDCSGDPSAAIREQETTKIRKEAGEFWNQTVWNKIELQEDSPRRLDVWNAYQDHYFPEDTRMPLTWQQIAARYGGTPQGWEQKLAGKHFQVKADLAFLSLPLSHRWSGSDYERFRLRVFEGRDFREMPRHLRPATDASFAKEWKKTVVPVLEQTEFIPRVEKAIPLFRDARRTSLCCELFLLRVTRGEEYLDLPARDTPQRSIEAQNPPGPHVTAPLQALWIAEIAPIARNVFDDMLRAALKMS